MYQQGDQVVYGIHGVCRILDLELRKVDRKNVEYYVLEPIDQSGARFYVPTQNEAAVAKLRPLITQKELDALLRSDDATEDVWIEDENQRKQYYRELITSGDRAAQIRMIHALHIHKRKLAETGRKFHLCDENFLRDAEKLLSSELSLIMNIELDQVGTYIQNAMMGE